MLFDFPEPLSSPRLLLRHVQASDLPDLLQVNGSDEVTRFLPYATWQNLDDGQAWLDRMVKAQATGTALQWAVVNRASGQVMGTCLLFRYDQGSARAELGYVLGQAHWRQGYMREALQAVVTCAFDTLLLRRLEAEVDPRNTASIQLLLQLGFVTEGLLRQRWMNKGEAVDVAALGLLRSEWAASAQGQHPP